MATSANPVTANTGHSPATLRGIEVGTHSLSKRVTNLLSIGIPVLGTVAAVFWFAGHPLTWIEVSSFFIFYVLSGIGVGIGLHRTFTHQAIVPCLPLKIVLAFLGSLAFQGSVLRWAADHRRHHHYTDVVGDTHSPITTMKGAFSNRVVGLIHAHLGWMFDGVTTDYRVYTPDMLKDRLLMVFHFLYWPLCATSLLLPFAYGYFLGGLQAAMGCLLLGGCVRTAALHNVIWAINSVGHAFGAQDASDRDSSRNSFWLAMLTFGEGWHNNHHTQPRSAFNDWKWYQFDLNGIIIRLLVFLRLARDPVFPQTVNTPEARVDALVYSDVPSEALRPHLRDKKSKRKTVTDRR